MTATGTATSKPADARARSRAAGAEAIKRAEEQRGQHEKHGKRKKHRRKRHKRKNHHQVSHPHGTLGVTVPVAPASPPAPSPAPVPSVGSPPITLGAGAAPAVASWLRPRRPARPRHSSGQPLEEVVFGLTRPSGAPTLTGPEPVNEEGKPLEPDNAWGDDHCWWLDRMVRSDQQLVERMTLIFHDWFATSNNQVNSQPLMLEQNELLRSMALGSFDELFLAVTTNPAMLLFLNGTSNNKWDPNENYAREMMELFSLGADRGAYTEDDVREMARTLTGWRNDWSEQLGSHNFRFDPSYHDAGKKTVFGQTGKWNYEDAVRLCVSHPLHRVVLRDQAMGLLHPQRALGSDARIAARSVYELGLQHPRGSRGDPAAPRLLRRPRDGDSRRWSTTPGCCARSRGRSTRTRGHGFRPTPASSCSIHRTYPAGTSPAGWIPRPRERAGKWPAM